MTAPGTLSEAPGAPSHDLPHLTERSAHAF